MKATEVESALSTLLADLNEEGVLVQVRRRLEEGEDPLLLVEESQQGMRQVGERYERGIYFISGLIMAGEIMHQVGDIVLPLLKSRVSGDESGTILLGTVEGDIHYIGKDIIKVLLQCYGFTVFDIGVDVPPKTFVAKTLEIKPGIIGLSCLLSSCFESMRATIELLRAEAGRAGLEPSFIIGGLVDEQVCRHVGSDHWAADAMTGVRLCQQMIRQRH
jgi:methanogenic corrinoid protein MtbC1